MKLTVAKVEDIATKLRDLPAAEQKERTVSKQETVRMLVKEIEQLQKRGYSLEHIAELLGAHGLEITPGTLRSYLRRISTDKHPKTKRTPPKAAPSEAADTPRRPAVEPKQQAKGTFTPRPDTEDL